MGVYDTLPNFERPLIGYERYLSKLSTIYSGKSTQNRVFITGFPGVG